MPKVLFHLLCPPRDKESIIEHYKSMLKGIIRKIPLAHASFSLFSPLTCQAEFPTSDVM